MFFDFLPTLTKLKLLNKFSTSLTKKNKKISKKQYNYYISLLKQYRSLGIFAIKNIKFIKIK